MAVQWMLALWRMRLIFPIPIWARIWRGLLLGSAQIEVSYNVAEDWMPAALDSAGWLW